MEKRTAKDTIEIIAVIVFFTAFVLSLMQSIRDPDMFWHLKTGEWIWDNKTLPDKDPFSFTADTSPESEESAKFILKQYWLGQLMMFGFYKAGGMYGILAFRCVIYLGIVLFLYLWIRRGGLGRPAAALMLIPSVYFSIMWLGERPNNLSFLFSVLVVYLLEDLRVRGSRLRRVAGETEGQRVKGAEYLRYCALPFTMLLWANMHGGFIFGSATIVIYCFSEVVSLYFRKKRNLQTGNIRTFLIICLISFGAGFLNPNVHEVIFRLAGLAAGEYSAIPIAEHLSVFEYASIGYYKYLALVTVFIVPFLLRAKGLPLSTLLLAVFLLAMSLTSVRYIGMYVFILTPVVAGQWGGLIDRIFLKAERYRIAVIIVFVVSLFFAYSNYSRTVFKNDLTIFIYPEETMRFIKTEQPEPEIFNEFVLGGYLMWSLYPDYRVFIDGRRLFRSTEPMYLKVYSGSTEQMEGSPAWKAILDRYRVNSVVVIGVNFITGDFSRIVRRLVEDREWSLVFMDREALLFLRDTGRNKEIIKRRSLPKVLAYGKALEQAELYRLEHPGSWRAYIPLGEINLYMGRPETAVMHFESAIMLNSPLASTALPGLIRKIRSGEDYTGLMEEIFR